MITLPANFPVETLNITNAQKVQWFYKRYVEDWYQEYRIGHFVLAAYAAVPAFLTPDLLYKIWQNFNGYRWSGAAVSVHRVAVADILLSPLCREVGFELYEMHHELRLAFLEWLEKEGKTTLWQKRGLRTIAELAEFIQEYNSIPNAGGQRWGSGYTERQSLEALSYSQPGVVAQVLLKKMAQTHGKSETELLQTMDVFIKTKERLEKLYDENGNALQLFNRQADLIEAWKALIQQNSPAFIKSLTNNPGLWDMLSDVENGGLRIVLPDAVPEIFAVKEPATLWALIVGIEEVHSGAPREYGSLEGENDALLMADCLRSLKSPEYLRISCLTGADATKEGIYRSLSEIVSHCREEDSFLFYISANATKLNGQCYVICYDTVDIKDDPSYTTFFSGAEYGTRIEKIRCQSLTTILEMPYAGTVDWLYINSEKKELVLATCTADQVPYYKRNETIEGRCYSHFTYQLVEHLKKGYSSRNIRELFIETIKRFVSLPQIQALYNQNSHALHRPQLSASPNALNQSFVQSSKVLGRLQTLLRQTDFYDGKTNGIWDSEAENSLQSFSNAANLAASLPKENYIALLEAWKRKDTNNKPIFLLIFSDPEKRLRYMNREVNDILNLRDERFDKDVIEFEVLHDPSKKNIADVFKNRSNRNRIQFVYYWGYDANGDFVLSDGTFSVFDFASLLDFQENIHLFVSNTCRSKYFAEYVSQLGVRFAIGAEDNINDDFAYEFGITLFNQILERENLERYVSSLTRKGEENLNRFYFFKAPWAGTVAAVAKKEWLEKAPLAKSTVYGVFVGIDEYTTSPLHEAVNDTRKMVAALTTAGRITTANTTVFENAAATRSAVLEQITHYIANAAENDVVLFYFSGHANTSNEAHQIFFHDFDASSEYLTEEQNGILSDRDFQALVKRAAARNFSPTARNPSIVLILDADAGSRQWLDETNPKHFVLMATHAGEHCMDISGSGAVLTNAIVKAISSSAFRLTYKSLYRFVFSEFLNSQVKDSQTPLFLATSDAWNTAFLSNKTGQDDILQLQEYLSLAGYTVERDGIKGPQTQKAMEDFKAKYAITRAGDAGIMLGLINYHRLKEKFRIRIVTLIRNGTETHRYFDELNQKVVKHRAEITGMYLNVWR